MTTADDISASKLKELVRIEQVTELLRNHPIAVVGSSVVATILAFGLQTHRETPVWLAALIGFNLVRHIVVGWTTKGGLNRNNVDFNTKIMALGLFSSGLIWSYVPLYMMNTDGAESVFTVLVIIGLTSASMMQGSCYCIGPICFISPVLLTIGYQFGATESFYGSMLMFSIYLYFAFLIKTGYRTQDSFQAAFFLKHEALAANSRLDRLANHDPLTGLFNRTAFSKALHRWIETVERQGTSFSLFLLDLDHFKSINDTLGHGSGDEVLQHVARRLRASLGPDPVIARLGGDEFAVLLCPGDEPEADGVIADRLIGELSGTVKVERGHVGIGVSLGMVSYSADCSRAEDLLARADLALYAAKDSGRQRSQRYAKSMLDGAEIARDLETDLPGALISGDLDVWYQPQLALRDGRLVGLEALIRWRHPRHGWIAPPSIVAAAAKTRISDTLTGFVLGQACAMIARLSREGQVDVVVAVNVSPAELHQYSLRDLVKRTIEREGIDPQRLELEITEESFVAGESAVEILRELSTLGVRIAIDDFGAGFSSIGYLRHQCFNRIKIDRRFITGLVENRGDRILVQAMLGIGRSFEIDVVAEGIETHEEALLLQSFGCPVGQGYHFGRPMGIQALDVWLAQHHNGRNSALLKTA